MRMLSIIRTAALLTILGILSWKYVRSKLASKKNQELTEEIPENFQQDEQGLYPWEKDVNDSPDRIPENAKRYSYDSGRPKRGKW